MTTLWNALLALTLTAFVAACAETGTYPVSGEECGPGDPVQELEARDCTPPV